MKKTEAVQYFKISLSRYSTKERIYIFKLRQAYAKNNQGYIN